METFILERLDGNGRVGAYDWLWQVENPPRRIWVEGNASSLSLLEKLPHRGLAIVGTREPQTKTLHLIDREIARLAGADLVIVSGFARGVDTQAHEAALDSELPTIAVLGCGISVTYPPENAALRNRIVESGGLVLTEFPETSPPARNHFLRRNRLIAAASKATWVVEAPIRSGALNTARYARDMDRMIFATPCFPGDRAFDGNSTLISRDHAYPFWGAESLGAAWLELNARSYFSERENRLNSATGLPERLISQAQFLTEQQGRFRIDQLLDWAMSESVTPMEFFAAFQKVLELGAITEKEEMFSTPDFKSESRTQIAAG